MFFELDFVRQDDFFLNFCTSKRGAGKSFGSIKDCVQRFLDYGEHFVYLRRSQTELDLALPSIFQPLSVEGYFSDKLLTVKNECFYCDGQIMGRGIAISTAYKLKSVSFPKVKTILFDEFISESNSYLKDEVTKFLSVIETIGRMRDINIFCLANKSTIYNPYYVYFDVKPASSTTPKTRFRSKSIMIYQFISEEYKNKKLNTKFGKLISGTTYGDFMLNDEAIQDNYDFVDKLNGVKKNVYINLYLGGENIVVYDCTVDNKHSLFFKISPVIDNKLEINFDKMLIKDKTIEGVRKNSYFKRIQFFINRGQCYFYDVRTKNLIQDFIF